jgi:Glycosyl hydrolase catalytic core
VVTWQGDRGRRLVRTFALALAALALIGALAAARAGAVPAKFWGVVPQSLPTEEEFQRLQRGGTDSLRFPIEWSSVEAEPGKTNWNYVDSMVKETAAAGIEPLPFITGAPEWAVKPAVVYKPAHSVAPSTLPVKTAAQRNGWQNFLREAARRYGPGGSFWADHPNLPDVPVRTWQIWNEPNFKYFVAAPNPADYGKLVKLSNTAIKSVDPGAQLILGGLFAEPKEAARAYRKMKPRPALFATEFLEKMYKANPGIKSKFQGIALHPYSIRYQHLTEEIEKVRNVLRRAGDPDKGLWITELGWSSERPVGTDQFAKGRQGQVRELEGAFRLFESKIAKWHLKRVFWFSVDDHAGSCNFCGGSGLFTESFEAKPSWKAFVKFAGGTP